MSCTLSSDQIIKPRLCLTLETITSYGMISGSQNFFGEHISQGTCMHFLWMTQQTQELSSTSSPSSFTPHQSTSHQETVLLVHPPLDGVGANSGEFHSFFLLFEWLWKEKKRGREGWREGVWIIGWSQLHSTVQLQVHSLSLHYNIVVLELDPQYTWNS